MGGGRGPSARAFLVSPVRVHRVCAGVHRLTCCSYGGVWGAHMTRQRTYLLSGGPMFITGRTKRHGHALCDCRLESDCGKTIIYCLRMKMREAIPSERFMVMGTCKEKKIKAMKHSGDDSHHFISLDRGTIRLLPITQLFFVCEEGS